MKKVLISNPFLFPPSGDNEEERELFRTRADFVKEYILYSLKDFNQVWKTEADTASGNNSSEKIDLFPQPIPSPTLSTASTEFAAIDIEMEFGDGMLDDLNNFDLDDIQFSPCYPLSDSEKDSFPQKEKELSADESRKGLIQTTDQALSQIELASEPSMFPVHTERETFSEIKKTAETTVVESNIMDSWGSQIMDGESVCLHLPETEATDNFDNLLQIAANDPDPPMQVVHSDLKTVDPTHVYFAQNTMHHHPDVKVENSNPTLVSASARPSRQRRKSVQTSRNCQDSPLTFHMDNEETIDLQALGRSVVKTEHTKPFALAALNGTDSRSRDRSTSVASTSDIGSPGSVKPRKSGEGKRKRKYEFEDDNDPSVKNAKAAKMNRDKKKQMMQELQQKVGHLTAENENLTEQRDRIQSQYDQLERQRAQEIYQLQQRLQAEISKNAANSKQKVKMLDLIKDVVGVVNPPPQVICVSDRLASTPMPDSSELEGIRNMQNIPQSGMNTYLTFKVGIGGTPSILFDCENRAPH